jgi:SAM-dependent methyltransferase/uncharacterized protein YbaR (Trm112 family)
MLRELIDRLLCPGCRDSRQTLRAEVFSEGVEGHVRTGVVVCSGCRRWYPIEEDLLDLTGPDLAEPAEHEAFEGSFARELSARRLTTGATATSGGEASGPAVAAKMNQRRVFDWYATNDQQTYRQYARLPFWTAVDERTFARWRARVRADEWVLDVGCANGRSSFPMLGDGRTVIGFDISRQMVREAIERARRDGVHAKTTFFIGDAARPPLRDGSFGCVLGYGVLHHLPDPAHACRDLLRLIRPGGLYLGCENNKTKLRGIFDALQRRWPQWVEEAGEEPLISSEMIREWIDGIPCRLSCESRIFMPPHVVNAAGSRWGSWLIALSDGVCSRLPGLRDIGGLIFFEIEKR